MDTVSRETRSRIMAAVPQKHSDPELLVRSVAHALGYRFRLHQRGMPGSPDLVFPRLRKVVFVHGCFWHRHRCKFATTPKSNVEFWDLKFRANLARDRRVTRALRTTGWSVLIIWECQAKRPAWLLNRLSDFLSNG